MHCIVTWMTAGWPYGQEIVYIMGWLANVALSDPPARPYLRCILSSQVFWHAFDAWSFMYICGVRRVSGLARRVLCGCSVHGTRNERVRVCHDRVGIIVLSVMSGSVRFFTETTGSLRNPETRRTPSYVKENGPQKWADNYYIQSILSENFVNWIAIK